MTAVPITALLAAAILLLVYPYAIYPCVVRLVPSRRRPAGGSAEDLPSVAMVIAALNEEKIIRKKLDNCFNLDYPRDRFSVYLVNDGSTDQTAAIARDFVPAGLQLIDRAARRGKVTNLNEIVPSLEADIVLLSDANVIYHPKAIRRLVARFADPSVGCVSGRVELTGTTEALRSSEEAYYSIEWRLQEEASRIHSMCGVDGAMHAFRRELFTLFPDDTLIEDFVLGMGIVRQGYRVVYEPSALAWEQGPATIGEEYRRKVRIAAGAAQSLLRGNGVPWGTPAVFWFLWISHKLLRWLSPFFLFAVLALAAVSWPHPLSQAVVLFAAIVALLALLRAVTGWSTLVLNAPFYFLFGQLAAGWGFLKGLLGLQSVLWTKANR